MKPKRFGSNQRRGVRIRIEQLGRRYRFRILDHFGFLITGSKFSYTLAGFALRAGRRKLAALGRRGGRNASQRKSGGKS
jgi:hypothetical protein